MSDLDLITDLLTDPGLEPLKWLWVLSPKKKLKRCAHCKLKKLLSCFNRRKRAKDGLQPTCRACNKLASRAYYRHHRSKHLREVRRLKNIRRAKARWFHLWYLAHHPCVDCGETDPVVLEFDHLRDKRKNLSSLISSGYSIETILNEIKKCEVRCANCHHRRTAKTFNWWKYKVSRTWIRLGIIRLKHSRA